MLAVFETNTYACGGTALAAFQMIISLVVGRRWRRLTLTLYPLRRDGVGGI